jgi:predicted dehydrogenase
MLHRLGTVHTIHIMYNIHHPEEVCARLPGIIRQIGTHHAYIALYLLGNEVPETVSAMRATLRDQSTSAQVSALCRLLRNVHPRAVCYA